MKYKRRGKSSNIGAYIYPAWEERKDRHFRELRR